MVVQKETNQNQNRKTNSKSCSPKSLDTPIKKKAEPTIKYPNWQHVMFDDLDIDLGIDVNAVSDFREMWESGISVKNIAKVLKRKPIEVVLLIVDQEFRGLIKQRERGLDGL